MIKVADKWIARSDTRNNLKRSDNKLTHFVQNLHANFTMHAFTIHENMVPRLSKVKKNKP